jgi:predicted PurR-regulated permease PerM
MFKKENNSILNVSILIIIFVLIFYVLKIWASLITPFIIALLFSFALIWLSNFYKKIVRFNFISFILSLTTYIFLFWFIWKMIGSNIEDLIRLLPEYQYRISQIISQIFDFFNIKEFIWINQILQKIDLQYLFSTVIGGITSIFSSAWLILFYVLFILLEYRFFKDKLNLIFVGNSNKHEIINTIEKVKSDIKTYFVIKTIVSFITASLSYILMISLWLDFAIFWSFLIFVLNFIPNIWSIIAVLFPAMLSLIQFDTYYTFVFLTTGLVWIQVLMWNIIEPRFMWNRLNLSPLVIIIALWFWWTMWWIIWMLLSVPIMVIINIILAKIPSTRWLAILLSEKWELQVEGWEEVMKTRKKLLKSLKNKFWKK